MPAPEPICCAEASPIPPQKIQANQSAMVEEKSMKGATPQHREVPSFPREGSGFAHIKLELSALHWQQEQALATIVALIEELDTVDSQDKAISRSKEVPVVKDVKQEALNVRDHWEPPSHGVATADRWNDKPVKSSGTYSRYQALMQQHSGDVKQAAPTLGQDGFTACMRWWCVTITSSRYFDYVIGILILVNSLLVGAEIELGLRDIELPWMQPLDTAFIVVYCIEIGMRLIGSGWRQCFADGWFLLDFVLVVVGVITGLAISVSGGGGDLGLLESVLVIRAMRLLRLIRALRMLKYFRTVWRLVYGLLTSHNAMFSTLALILLTLYIFACLGVELIKKDEDLQRHAETEDILKVNFASVPGTMLTLMQFVTMDSVAYVYFPLVRQKPFLALYFIAIVLIVSIALMNLVTAVLVEGALENAQNDKEADKNELQEKLKRAVPRLRQVFLAMDANGDGNVSLEEIEAVPVDVLPKELFEKSGISSMQEIFAILDVDGGGELSQDEFVDGLLDIFFRDVPLETVQTLKLLRSMEHRLNMLKELMVMFQSSIQVLHAPQIPRPHLPKADHGTPSESFRLLLS